MCARDYQRWKRHGDPTKVVRLRNVTMEERFWFYVDKRSDDECWEWQGRRSKKGYGTFRADDHRRTVGAHRISWEIHNGPLPIYDGNNGVVMHSCDNPPCVNPAHLHLGTNAENTAHMIEAGRANFGWLPGKHPLAKLTEEQVREIRQRYADGETSRELGNEYGVHQDTITNLAAGRTYRWVE
jgi:HNH endonuclease